MRIFLHNFVRRHRRKLVVVTAIAIVASAVAVSPGLQHQTSHVWGHALVWAGLRETVHDPSAVYWCPMHPQIKRNDPNEVCPICNMALVELEGGEVEAPEHLSQREQTLATLERAVGCAITTWPLSAEELPGPRSAAP